VVISYQHRPVEGALKKGLPKRLRGVGHNDE
jgi:hypothetical protein